MITTASASPLQCSGMYRYRSSRKSYAGQRKHPVAGCGGGMGYKRPHPRVGAATHTPSTATATPLPTPNRPRKQRCGNNQIAIFDRKERSCFDETITNTHTP
jgi:hypothetical protein